MAKMPQRYPQIQGIRFDDLGRIYVGDTLVATIDTNGDLKIEGDVKTNQSL